MSCWSNVVQNEIPVTYYAHQLVKKFYITSVKGLLLDAFSPQAIVYCYLEFKLSYLKNLNFFKIRVKELSEPIVLFKKGDGFQLFL